MKKGILILLIIFFNFSWFSQSFWYENKYILNNKLDFNSFNSLSLDDKNYILTTIREKNNKNNYINSIFSEIQEDLEKEWKFILDLSDKEFEKILLNKMKKWYYEFRSVLSSCDAPLVKYPTFLKYKEKSSYDRVIDAYDYRSVKTDPNEYFCDTELLYAWSWNYVWSDMWIPTQLIKSYWWLSYREVNWFWRVVVWVKAKAFWLLDVWLKNRIKLLK